MMRKKVYYFVLKMCLYENFGNKLIIDPLHCFALIYSTVFENHLKCLMIFFFKASTYLFVLFGNF